MMFKVTYANTILGKKQFWVYDIRYDNQGKAHFLMFIDNKWQLISADYWKPVDTKQVLK